MFIYWDQFNDIHDALKKAGLTLTVLLPFIPCMYCPYGKTYLLITKEIKNARLRQWT